MLSRGANTTGVDAALSNPAGLAFLPKDGFYTSLSIQSAFQTRNIDASCEALGLDKYYEGKASAPVIPSVFAAYKKGDWTISGFFGITGGGGKASFDDGLSMFDAMVIGGLGQQGIPGNAYSLNSYMDGKQYIYSVQLGLTYKITDWLSAFAGGRMNYFTGGYKGALNASAAVNLPLPAGGAIPVGTELIGIDLDCSQTGWGFTPVIGLDAKFGKLTIGAKYEFKANLNIENNTKLNSLRMVGAPESELEAYKHGVNTPNDIPAMLSVAAAYEFLPVLRASVEYHFYDDKNAGMADGKQKYLTKGTNEYLAGIEWDVIKRLTLSGGVQFTDYGLSGICIMQLSGLLAPGRGPKAPAVELDLFPDVAENALSALFAARVPLLPGDTAADFWLGLLNAKLGRALWQAAGLPDADVHRLSAAQWQKLAHIARHWRFEGLTPCGWKQAQVTGGGLALTELEPDFQFKGCPGLYFVGETLDCVGRCGGFNLHWAFGSGLAAGRSAAKPRRAVPSQKPPRKKKH